MREKGTLDGRTILDLNRFRGIGVVLSVLKHYILEAYRKRRGKFPYIPKQVTADLSGQIQVSTA